jgi:hypothetical protein
MKKQALLSALAILLAAGASPAEAMRCGNRIVSTGDHQAKVKALCGEPDQAESRTVYRSGLPRQQLDVDVDGSAVVDRELLIHNRSLVEVEVEVWLFNRGPRRLMREVVFRDNKVIDVKILGYGY